MLPWRVIARRSARNSLLTIVLAALCATVAARPSAPERDTIRVGKLAFHAAIHPHRNVEVESRMLMDFASAHAIRLEWVESYRLDELAKALANGDVDVSLSPLPASARETSRTLAPIGLERYRVVARYDTSLDSPLAFAGKRVAIKLSSPMREYLDELAAQIDDLNIIILPDDLSRDKVLRGVSANRYDAVVIATDFGRESLSEHPRLAYQFDLTGLESVSWLIGDRNHDLEQKINQFVERYHAAYLDPQFKAQQFHDIKQRGLIRAITRVGKGYYVKKGRPRGFDYELARRFAAKHHLRLEVLVAQSDQEMLRWLKDGVGDFIMTQLSPALVFGEPAFKMSREYRHDIPVVVSLATRPLESIAALQGLTVGGA